MAKKKSKNTIKGPSLQAETTTASVTPTVEVSVNKVLEGKRAIWKEAGGVKE